MARVKLTLNIEDSVVARAKKYAGEHKTSLSRMVENYLAALAANKQPEARPMAGWIKELRAVKKPVLDFDHKSAYEAHLVEKYAGKKKQPHSKL